MVTDTVENAAIDIDWIVSELDAGMDQLPEEAIRAAQKNREHITPRLIQIIQDATQHAMASGDRPDGNAHFFALFLLTEFQVKKALPAILDAITLPDDLPYDLFGDALSVCVPQALATLSSDPLQTIDRLLTDSSVDEYVRWEAAHAYLLLVRDGHLTRDQAVERLCNYLREAIVNQDVELTSLLVSELASYSPSEAIDVIEEAFQKDLVDEFLIDMADVERSIAGGESHFHDEMERASSRVIEDTVEELKTWASFQEKPEPRPDPRPAEPTIDPDHDVGKLNATLKHEEQFQSSTIRNTTPRVGRNAPCPCGSGKKYKKCCGAS